MKEAPRQETRLLCFLGAIILTSRCISGFAAATSGHQQQLKVSIVGGTHGNEYTGVWCAAALEERKAQLAETYPHLEISTLTGNPQAVAANRRFVDTDLNREFGINSLSRDLLSNSKDHHEDNPDYTVTVEAQRAAELNKLLGPKENPATDVIIDLHSTTSNMGMTLIVCESDIQMTQAAAYALHKFNQQHQGVGGASDPASATTCNNNNNNINTNQECKILLHQLKNRLDRPHLNSIARSGLTIEVGPVPQGVLRHDAVQQTEEVLTHVLEFLELNQQQQRTSQDKGQETTEQVLAQYYPDGIVPCFRSAPAVRGGELSGKIPWPSLQPSLPDFPAYMVHQDVQDRDFKLIRTGDPLFVTIQGDVIPYDGVYGDAVYLMFVNEGGYYAASSGTGVAVAVKTFFVLDTGRFVPCDAEHHEENMDNVDVCSFA